MGFLLMFRNDRLLCGREISDVFMFAMCVRRFVVLCGDVCVKCVTCPSPGSRPETLVRRAGPVRRQPWREDRHQEGGSRPGRVRSHLPRQLPGGAGRSTGPGLAADQAQDEAGV